MSLRGARKDASTFSSFPAAIQTASPCSFFANSRQPAIRSLVRRLDGIFTLVDNVFYACDCHLDKFSRQPTGHDAVWTGLAKLQSSPQSHAGASPSAVPNQIRRRPAEHLQ